MGNSCTKSSQQQYSEQDIIHKNAQFNNEQEKELNVADFIKETDRKRTEENRKKMKGDVPDIDSRKEFLDFVKMSRDVGLPTSLHYTFNVITPSEKLFYILYVNFSNVSCMAPLFRFLHHLGTEAEEDWIHNFQGFMNRIEKTSTTFDEMYLIKKKIE